MLQWDPSNDFRAGLLGEGNGFPEICYWFFRFHCNLPIEETRNTCLALGLKCRGQYIFPSSQQNFRMLLLHPCGCRYLRCKANHAGGF